MLEPDVTLTDYVLSVECMVCGALLGRTPTDGKWLRTAGICFFIFFGLSAATGGTVHGFCPEVQSPTCQFLWRLTLEGIGLAAFAAWILGAGFLATGRTGHWLAFAALPQIAVYNVLLFLVTWEFWVVFTIYLPAALLLLAGFCRVGRERRFAQVGAVGSVLSFVSSFLQFLKIGIDPVYFNHNALAHVVQGIALALMFLGIRAAVHADFLESRVAQAGISRP
jgi:hypothetical protein